MTSLIETDVFEDDPAQVRHVFDKLVNMSADEIEAWLQTAESQSVGVDSGDGESIGHKSGEKIAAILRADRLHVSVGDVAHMRKVIGYIKRHLAQRPQRADLETSRWRYSLMNWGHDPLKG